MAQEFILPADIPDSLMIEIVERLALHTVAFLRIEDTSDGRDAFLLGSGILVTISDVSAILTASHVIRALPRIGRLGIFLSATFTPHSIDTEGVTFLDIARGNDDSLGPDLGAVLLAPPIASAIAAKKTFYNLQHRRDELLHNPPDAGDGLWLTLGFVDEKTQVKPDTVSGYGLVKSFYIFGGVGRPTETIQIGDHDYYTVPIIPTSTSPIPRRFGGMSGGGLWQVPLARDESGALVQKAPALSGIAFYQSAINAVGSTLRCHGRSSLFRIAYDAIVCSPSVPSSGEPTKSDQSS